MSKTPSKPSFGFLSQPPPQKKKPTIPPPNPPPLANSTDQKVANIAAWAALVHPGAPAPLSPPTRPQGGRRSSITYSRRASISRVLLPPGVYLPEDDDDDDIPLSPPFIDSEKSEAFITDPAPNLASLGYSTLFVHLPKGKAHSPGVPPTHHSKSKSCFTKNDGAVVVPDSPTSIKSRKKGGYLRALPLFKRMRTRSTSLPPSPKQPESTKKKTHEDATITKPKKPNHAKYGHYPPPLATELALAQFMSGGTVESNVRHVMQSHTKAAARSGGGQQNVGVADVHRDGNGGYWRDRDEEWEYALLLGGATEDAREEWVKFGVTRVNLTTGEERKLSVSTVDSSLNPDAIVLPADPDQLVASAPKAAHDMSDHSLDMAFIPRTDAVPPVGNTTTTRKPHGTARRRPPPLKLVPRGGATGSLPASPAIARRDFIDSSFSPAPLPSSSPTRLAHARGAEGTGSDYRVFGRRMAVKALFKPKRR